MVCNGYRYMLDNHISLNGIIRYCYRTQLFVKSLQCLTKSSISQGKKAVGLKFHNKKAQQWLLSK